MPRRSALCVLHCVRHKSSMSCGRMGHCYAHQQSSSVQHSVRNTHTEELQGRVEELPIFHTLWRPGSFRRCQLKRGHLTNPLLVQQGSVLRCSWGVILFFTNTDNDGYTLLCQLPHFFLPGANPVVGGEVEVGTDREDWTERVLTVTEGAIWCPVVSRRLDLRASGRGGKNS